LRISLGAEREKSLNPRGATAGGRKMEAVLECAI